MALGFRWNVLRWTRWVQPLLGSINNDRNRYMFCVEEGKKFQEIPDIVRFLIQLVQLVLERNGYRLLLVRIQLILPFNYLSDKSVGDDASHAAGTWTYFYFFIALV
jgi:hypothetical protein